MTGEIFDIPSFPSIRSLLKRVSYLFVNTIPLVDFTRPVPEKVKFVGGIGVESPLQVKENEVWKANDCENKLNGKVCHKR